MSNISLDFNFKNNDKIIIKDDSDDSFYSKKLSKKQSKKTKNSLFKKFGNIENNNEVTAKTNKKKTYKKNYNGIKNQIKNETKKILETSYDDFYKTIEEYYDDVLKWVNLVFTDNANSILKVKINKITLNEDIFNKYNEIITKHNLKKNKFDINNFNFDSNIDYNLILGIAKTMTKNLLDKLNYKLDIVDYGNIKKLKIKNLSNQI